MGAMAISKGIEAELVSKRQQEEELLEAARAKGEKAVKAVEEKMAFKRRQAAFLEGFRQQQSSGLPAGPHDPAAL